MSNVLRFPSSEDVELYTEDEFINELNGAGHDDSEFRVCLSRLVEDQFGEKGEWCFSFAHPEELKLCVVISGTEKRDGEYMLKEYSLADAVSMIEKIDGFDDLCLIMER